MARERKLKRAKEREKTREDWGRGRGNACFWERVSGKRSHHHSSNRIGNNLIFQLFPRLINALQRNAVSKIIVVTPLVVIMKDQVEQLQSIGIRALAIEVDEEEAGEMDRLNYL